MECHVKCQIFIMALDFRYEMYLPDFNDGNVLLDILIDK